MDAQRMSLDANPMPFGEAYPRESFESMRSASPGHAAPGPGPHSAVQHSSSLFAYPRPVFGMDAGVGLSRIPEQRQ